MGPSLPRPSAGEGQVSAQCEENSPSPALGREREGPVAKRREGEGRYGVSTARPITSPLRRLSSVSLAVWKGWRVTGIGGTLPALTSVISSLSSPRLPT